MIIDLLALVGLASWTTLLYLHSITSEFTFDDPQILNVAEELRDAHTRAAFRAKIAPRPSWRARLSAIPLWGHIRSSNRHLLWKSYLRDCRQHGRDPVGWRLTNIAIHVVNVALIYGILRGTFSVTVASLGAVIYAGHPLGSGTVATLSGRSSALCAAFYLAGLLALMAGQWFLAALFAFAAWKTKEEALMFPIVAAVTLYLISSQ